MAYELWSTISGTLLQIYATELRALLAVRAKVEAHGRPLAEAFALGYEDACGRSRSIAQGKALIERALEVATA